MVRQPRLQAASSAAKGSAVMEVKDTGIGIRPEFLPHIFESFAQDRRPETANILGTGLGLAIVKRTVAQLGGSVTVESTVDVGSVFRVALPLPRASREQQGGTEPAGSGTILAGRTVLLCEDNALNTEIARMPRITDIISTRRQRRESSESALTKISEAAHNIPIPLRI